MNLGRAIKLCRIQRFLNQSELAKIAGISTGYLSLLESNKRDPTLSTIEKVSNALNVPVIILVFLAANDKEMSDLGSDLCGKLSYLALSLMKKEINHE
ncbi:MAG: helix-turn-helix transcriptional regulator [Candidatus Peribacteraceae bacterium]|nr:helix-turn-helix transcriptional regulator [Candidatus Peribacteraceae bacterium]